jgi:hypothetical protein
MSLSRLWRASASSRFGLGALLAASLATTVVVSQEPWKKDYDAGVRAFEDNDFVSAEKNLVKAFNEAPKDQVRSETLVLTSQLRGFEPEFYLALTYLKLGRPDEALRYGKMAEPFLKPGNNLTKLKAAEAEATRQLPSNTVTPPVGGADSGRATTTGPVLTVPPPPVDVVTPIRTALNAGNLPEAHRLRDRAKAAGETSAGFTQVSREVDQKDVDAAVQDANQKLSAKQYADARSAVKGARAFGLDAIQLDGLDRDIDHAEAANELTSAQQALAAKDYPKATTSAQRVKTLGGDGQAADVILHKAAAGPTFETLLTQANAALARNAFVEATNAARRAKDLAVDDVRADALSSRIDAAERTSTAKLTADEQQRVGMRDFYSGDYTGAINVLTPLASGNLARVRLYLASAKAALSILESDPAKRQQLEASARQDFGPIASQRASLAADLTYLSPAIAHVLGIAR